MPELGFMAKIAKSDSTTLWVLTVAANSAATCAKKALSCPYTWTRGFGELMSTAYDGPR